ncbi:signal peptide peptidase SppA [Algisphaera agarilytica]|uniref:Protease-4 n=1 Tax=Algisphaera agarilytica TaxID=1385975 RepID=A0A7X0LMN0_9BACT|nr:signal peptide peptidase SppA [Algisphaera agarilytica]MBB6431193.1 protease-4 [Algisphaera agarilytica]
MQTLYRFVLLIALALLPLVGCGPATFVVGVAPGGQSMTTTPIERDGRWGSQHIMIIDVTGMIANADQGGLLSAGDNPVARLTEGLRLAANDNRVSAVVLRLNTPGGTVTASDMMYREVQRFKTKTGKPVVMVMMDVAASGGYYLACAGDHIIAYPSTVTGSIGVIFQTVSVKPALSRIGVEAEALVSGPNKAAGSPLETLEDSQREILQGLVDRFYADFVTVVRENRTDVDADTWDMITDGRVFTGRRAYELGLVDQLGDIRDGISKAKELSGASTADVFVAHRPLDYVSGPYSQAPATARSDSSTQINLLQINLDDALSTVHAADSGMYYLWVPELP